MSSDRERSFWGWGWSDRFPDHSARQHIARQVGTMLDFEGLQLDDPPRLEDIVLREARVSPPDTLAEICSSEREERIRHTYGRAFPDVLRGFCGDFSHAPDVVARPRSEQEVTDVLDWARDAHVAVFPCGGGTNVVGGIEPVAEGAYRGTVSLDLRGLNRVLEVDETSLSARIQAGATGPELEEQLAERGLTLRHYPQSFEFSTLGGWIATRAAGHFATVYQHVDDLMQSARMLTPRGPIESMRVPASGAGPAPEHLMVGSEGVFGIVTEASMRVRPRPDRRSTATVHFDDWHSAVTAVRALSQSGLFPSNCRLLDSREAALNFVTEDGSHVLLLGFESPGRPLEPAMSHALQLCREHGGRSPGPVHRHGDGRPGDEGIAGTWKKAFVEAPYLMNTLVSMGVIVDTFETCCTWDRFEPMHDAIVRNVRDAMKRVCGKGVLACRLTHVYPDGPAPYYTFIAPGTPGSRLEQWAEIKETASETLMQHGATITHHHAVGRTHRDWYRRQRSSIYGETLEAVKKTVDPDGMLNPGVLL